MTKTLSLLRTFTYCSIVAVLFCFSFVRISAQSQALNGQIEGTVSDSNGGSIPNAPVSVRNIETGAVRSVVSDSNGFYRIPLLPLGTYQVTVAAVNFKRLVRDGVTLSTGQTATVDVVLEAGAISETVNVSSDAPIADAGKIDVGRVMNAQEVQNLPLVSRNPYNYALLQANVTGRPNAEFGVPRISANGYARRTNYQLDGNNNTQADRGGIRLMPISETFISEVQLVTNGFSAEFGNTPGLIMNAVTPTGTNDLHGSASYRFRRTPFYARPFQYTSALDLPKTTADNLTFAVGGPIIKDRWHFYGGYEYVDRDLTAESGRLVTISGGNQAALIAAGVPSNAFVAAIPTTQKVNFYIVRTDAQLNDNNRLTGRFNYFDNNSPDNIAGGLNTLERSIDFVDKSYSLGIQLASIITPNILNEFRFQFAKRDSRNFANANSGTGPSIVVTGVANFGEPENDDTIVPLQKTTQFQDNLTWSFGNHSVKVGGGVNRIDDERKSNVFARYTFPSITAYLNAKNGTAPRGYTNYIEAFGSPEIKYKSTFYNLFAQDDWKATRKLKINYGVRYDLYDIPDAIANSPFPASQKYKVDRNNFAPRLGVVYGLRDGNLPTVIRASAGIYYDTVYLDLYQRALQNNGSPTFFNFSFGPTATATTPAGPGFPGTFGSLPAGATLPIQSIETIAPDFENMYAIHFNTQLEQALTENISFTVGFIHSSGRHIPIYRNINCLPTGESLADGRPVFGTLTVNAANGNASTSNCTNRLFPQFQNILMAEAAGNSDYNAATFQLSKRFSKGYQFSVNYTLSKSTDDAPEQNLVATQVGNLTLGDPTNRRFDKGLSLADQRHTFVMSFVGSPQFNLENKALKLLINNNQFGIITTANSGERFNIVTNGFDLNRDGFTGNERPVGIERNSGKTPKQFNVDLRYSRFFNFTERFKLEVLGEFVNIFNVNSIFQYNSPTVTSNNINTSVVDPRTGVIRSDLPDFRTQGITSLDSRQFQLGFKFSF